MLWVAVWSFFFFFQAEDGIRDGTVTGVQTCALPIYLVRCRLQIRLPRRRCGGGVTDTQSGVRGVERCRGGAGGQLQHLSDPCGEEQRSEERSVGKECRSRWSP